MLDRHRRSRRGKPTELAPVVSELFVAAQDEAIVFRHHWIGTEHVLLALLGRGDETAQTLRELGLDSASARRDVRKIVGDGPAPETVFDCAALGAIGIDLDAIRERVEATFGQGALERARLRRGSCGGAAFSVMPRLKHALAHAQQEAANRGSDITTADVAVGLADQRDSVAAHILNAHAITPEQLRAALADRRETPA